MEDTNVTRRDLLKTAGAAGIVGVAGCNGPLGSSDGSFGYGERSYGYEGYGGTSDDTALAVFASGDTLSRGGSATLSIEASSVGSVTVSKVWTDWTATDVNPDGATVSDEISEKGIYRFTWDSIQDSVSPRLTLSLPERYAGGRYALTVTANAAGDTERTYAYVVVE